MANFCKEIRVTWFVHSPGERRCQLSQRARIPDLADRLNRVFIDLSLVKVMQLVEVRRLFRYSAD